MHSLRLSTVEVTEGRMATDDRRPSAKGHRVCTSKAIATTSQVVETGPTNFSRPNCLRGNRRSVQADEPLIRVGW